MTQSTTRRQRGFTLIEMIMVIVLLGIVGSMVAVFMRSPISAYFDTARRAALSDAADTVVRRMARDLRKALPNSVRVNAASSCVEFIPTRTGGRYRAATNGAGQGDVLDFTTADNSFDVLDLNNGSVDQQIAVGDMIAIYNLGIAGANAYNGDNTSVVTSLAAGALSGETKIRITAKRFPFTSPNNRFQVIPGNETIVSYVCTGGNLYRNTNYAYTPSAPSCPTSGGNLMANGVSCTFTYNGSDLQRNGMVQVLLGLSSGGESVSIYHEINISNTP